MIDAEKILLDLPENPLLALEKVCTRIVAELSEYPINDDVHYYDHFISSISLLQFFLENHDLKDYDFKVDDYPELTNRLVDNKAAILHFFSELYKDIQPFTTKEKIYNYKSNFENTFGKFTFYNFSDSDFNKVQSLINEMRDIISGSKEIEEKHQVRLLKRLEKFQAEIHKNVSDLDRFWGFAIEASAIAGKVGENLKPLTDRLREIADIVWKSQKDAYGLPSGKNPLLLDSKDDEESS